MRKATVDNQLINNLISKWRETKNDNFLGELYIYVTPIIKSQIRNFTKKNRARQIEGVYDICFANAWDTLKNVARAFDTSKKTFNAYFRKCLYWDWRKLEKKGKLYSTETIEDWSTFGCDESPETETMEMIDYVILKRTIMEYVKEEIEYDLSSFILNEQEHGVNLHIKFIVTSFTNNNYSLASYEKKFPSKTKTELMQFSDYCRDIIQHVLITYQDDPNIPNIRVDKEEPTAQIRQDAEYYLTGGLENDHKDYIKHMMALFATSCGMNKKNIREIFGIIKPKKLAEYRRVIFDEGQTEFDPTEEKRPRDFIGKKIS